MNKFLFKSTDADLQKFTSILDTIQKNILYITYQEDKILKISQKLLVDKHLQKQVDDYFEKDPFGSQFRTANKIAEEDEL